MQEDMQHQRREVAERAIDALELRPAGNGAGIEHPVRKRRIEEDTRLGEQLDRRDGHDQRRHQDDHAGHPVKQRLSPSAEHFGGRLISHSDI